MITQIGIVAGEVWHFLDRQGNTSTVPDVVKNIDKREDIVLMSIGWLAREGHVVLEGEGPDYKVSLRE